MARARDPNRDKAFEIYKEHNGDIPLVEIAKQLGVAEGTVRGWKSKDHWDDKLEELSNGTFHSKPKKNTERSVKKKPKQNAPKKITKSKATVKFEIVESDGLNDKQLLFCMYYVKYFNATKAYQKAYETNYRTSMARGSLLLRNVKVREEIESLKSDLANGIMLDARSVLQKYMDIAFADVTDFTKFGSVEEPMIDDEGREILDDEGNPRTYTRSFVHLKNADEIDGTILTEVKKGKDGVSIKLADKMAALAMLAKYTDLLNDNERKQLQNEQALMNIDKTKADIMKIHSETKGANNHVSTVDLSGFTTEELRALAKRK